MRVQNKWMDKIMHESSQKQRRIGKSKQQKKSIPVKNYMSLSRSIGRLESIVLVFYENENSIVWFVAFIILLHTLTAKCPALVSPGTHCHFLL